MYKVKRYSVFKLIKIKLPNYKNKMYNIIYFTKVYCYFKMLKNVPLNQKSEIINYFVVSTQFTKNCGLRNK